MARLVTSCALGFPAAGMIALVLPMRPGVHDGGVSYVLILAGGIALTIACERLLGIVDRWRRRARHDGGVALAVASYRRSPTGRS